MNPLELLAAGAMSVAEAAEFCGLSRSNLYLLMETRRLAYSKVGKRRIIPKNALIELMEHGLVMPEQSN